jgi:hypothetical protein
MMNNENINESMNGNGSNEDSEYVKQNFRMISDLQKLLKSHPEYNIVMDFGVHEKNIIGKILSKMKIIKQHRKSMMAISASIKSSIIGENELIITNHAFFNRKYHPSETATQSDYLTADSLSNFIKDNLTYDKTVVIKIDIEFGSSKYYDICTIVKEMFADSNNKVIVFQI